MTNDSRGYRNAPRRTSLDKQKGRKPLQVCGLD